MSKNKKSKTNLKSVKKKRDPNCIQILKTYYELAKTGNISDVFIVAATPDPEEPIMKVISDKFVRNKHHVLLAELMKTQHGITDEVWNRENGKHYPDEDEF